MMDRPANGMEPLSPIYNLLYNLGVTANYTGFFHTAYAVYLAAREPERLTLVTKWLYPEVARRYNTTARSVERNIRTVAGIVWSDNRDRLEALTRCPIPTRPSASKFLAMLTSCIREKESK